MSHAPSRPLVACALGKERRFLAERLTGVEVLKTGLGVRRTTTSLQHYFDQNTPGLLIFTGTAGQLNPDLEVGQVVVPRRWRRPGLGFETADPRLVESLGDRFSSTVELGLTVAKPVIRAATRSKLYQTTGAEICDMESAGALEVARRYRLQALAVKVISDGGDSNFWSYFRDFDRHMGVLAKCLAELLQAIPKGQWVFEEDHSA